MNDRLFRSRTDRVIAGVCGGIADRFDLDPSLVRVGYAILWLFTGIFPLTVVYVLMAVVVPEEPGDAWSGFGMAGPHAGGSTYAAPTAAAAPTGPAGATPEGGAGFAGPEAASPATDAGDASRAAAEAAGRPSWRAAAPVTGADWRAEARADREARRSARRAARAERRSDPLGAIIVGLVLISIGAWFLLRNVVSIEWSLVWPAALLALGVLLVVIAVLPRPGQR